MDSTTGVRTKIEVAKRIYMLDLAPGVERDSSLPGREIKKPDFLFKIKRFPVII